MTTSKVNYLGELRTEAVHLKSGDKIICDAPTDNNGKGAAFSPTDLVATALASCMLTIIGIKANESKIILKDINANVTKIMGSNPRRISEIVIDFHFPNNSFSDKEKTIIERSAKTCPVALSLNPEIKKTLSFNF